MSSEQTTDNRLTKYCTLFWLGFLIDLKIKTGNIICQVQPRIQNILAVWKLEWKDTLPVVHPCGAGIPRLLTAFNDHSKLWYNKLKALWPLHHSIIAVRVLHKWCTFMTVSSGHVIPVYVLHNQLQKAGLMKYTGNKTAGCTHVIPHLITAVTRLTTEWKVTL